MSCRHYELSTLRCRHYECRHYDCRHYIAVPMLGPTKFYVFLHSTGQYVDDENGNDETIEITKKYLLKLS